MGLGVFFTTHGRQELIEIRIRSLAGPLLRIVHVAYLCGYYSHNSLSEADFRTETVCGDPLSGAEQSGPKLGEQSRP